jgi:PAT family beta-lactamase induction signal transducer AmpG
LRLIAFPDSLEINPEPRKMDDLKPLLSLARDWNRTNGFTRATEQTRSENKQQKPSLWSRFVSTPLANFLREHFGARAVRSPGIAGNIGFSYLRLLQAPGKEIIVTVALKSGDKSLSLLEGSRLVFDDMNWQKPAMAVFQLDPRLKTSATAIYEVRSGNVTLSWTVVFAVLVGLFLFFGLYHKFMLPHPVRDRRGSVAKDRKSDS